MRIGTITSTNFGLTKSPSYMGFENSLVHRIKNPKKKAEALNVVNAISKRVPEGYLDMNEENNAFLLYLGDKVKTSPLEISKVYPREPFKTILKLNKNLKNL